MSQYIETATDLNVEGVEFYVKNTPDGYIYFDEECTKRVDSKTLKHAFEMNDIVVVDNGLYCRPTCYTINKGNIVASYVTISSGTVTGKSVTSFDAVLDTDVTVAPDEDLFGKVIGDLQSDVVVGEDSITGTLQYVTNYTGFSSKVEEQSGNYLVIHNTTNLDTPIFVEIIGGTSGPIQLDSDGIIILLIRNNNQKVKVSSGDIVKEYSLKNLVLIPAPEAEVEE